MGEWLCMCQSISHQSINHYPPSNYPPLNHHAIIMQSPTNHSPFNHSSPTITTFTCKNTPTNTLYRANNVTTGASSDLQQASAIARGLVYEYGMMGVKLNSANHA